MTHTIIVGSGPAAAGAALALVVDPSQRVTILDIGHRLSPDNLDVVSRLGTQPPAEWSTDDIEVIRAQPSDAAVKGLPQKRSYGSNYPFQDVGQLAGVRGVGPVNTEVISGAYGGLSNVWGSQVMPFTAATFDDWPVSLAEMESHYRRILQEIPFAGEDDALAERFPLIAESHALPVLAPRMQSVMQAANRHQAKLRDVGVLVGRARLAFDASNCVRCGLCMTGCPYSLIYSSASTFDRLRREQRVEYHGGLLVTYVGEEKGRPFVLAKELDSDVMHRFEADRVMLGCGAMGTTRLVLGSLGIFDEDVELAESAQFVMPMLSMHPTPDPRHRDEFTLNQVNMAIATDAVWRDVAQIHFYPHNAAISQALPPILATRIGTPVASQVLRRLTVGLGYLPSWASSPVRARVERSHDPTALPNLVLRGTVTEITRTPMFRQVVAKVLKVAPRLDLWPVIPLTSLSGAAKSYHFGASFPHRTEPADGPLTTDRLGRLSRWRNVHLIDASVFPTIPATTFTLTIMANAHRIATEALTESR